jgi:hypothetical protein
MNQTILDQIDNLEETIAYLLPSPHDDEDDDSYIQTLQEEVHALKAQLIPGAD